MTNQKEEGCVAYPCVRVVGKDCDGCGGCVLDRVGLYTDEPERFPGDVVGFRCEECGEPAVYDGYYYEIEGRTLCLDCVDKLYRREAAPWM